MSKIEVSLQSLGDFFMRCKFPPIVRGDGMHLTPIWLQKLNHYLTDRLRGLALNLANQCESRLAFNYADNGLLMVFADDSISLPIADPLTLINDGGTIINRVAVWNNATPIRFAITLPALFLTAQMHPQCAASLLVCIDSLVQRFMANRSMPADLLRTPLLLYLLSSKLPCRFVYCPRIHRMPLCRLWCACFGR